MVTPLQLARVYATIGSTAFIAHCRLPKLTPRFPVNGLPGIHCSHRGAYDGKRGATGGGGVKAAIKGYRIAIKTGTRKRSGRTVATSINILLIPQGCACESAALRAGCCYQRSAGGKYYGGAVSAPVFGAIMGGVCVP